MGANQSKENIGSKLETAKVELARLRKELVEKKEKATHLEKNMQDK